MSLKSLINDPQFSGLSPEDQRRAVVGVEPQADQLSPQDYSTFISALRTPAESPGLLGRYSGPSKKTAALASDIVGAEQNPAAYDMSSPVKAATTLTKAFNPFPTSTKTASNPVLGPVEEKRKWLEGAGGRSKRAAVNSEGNMVSSGMDAASKYMPEPLAATARALLGIAGGTAQTLTELAPTRPSDFATEAGMGMLGPIMSRGTRGVQTEIANRNLQAPKAIQESRYMRGQPRVGEIALDTDKNVADLAVSNKDTMYKRANAAIETLGKKINDRINELFEQGRTPNTPDVAVPKNERFLEYKPGAVEVRASQGAPQPRYTGMLSSGESAGVKGQIVDLSDQVRTPGATQPSGAPYETALNPGSNITRYEGVTRTPSVAPKRPSKILGENYSRMVAPIPHETAVPTRSVADAIDPVIHAATRRDGADSAVVRNLIDLKDRFIRDNGEFMNALQANAERVRLGDEVGKGFNKETSAIPEVTEANRNMWIALRDKIGKMFPDLDEMLKLQHDLIDVRTSATPEAAKGFTKTAGNVVDAVKTPFRSIKIADFLGNQLGSGKAVGLGMGTGAGATAKGGLLEELQRQKKDKRGVVDYKWGSRNGK